MASSTSSTRTSIGGRELAVSNLEKVLFPESGFTKGQLIDYYMRISDVMLPHIMERPLTMKRFPDGVTGKSFFEKHMPSHAPAWVRSVEVPSNDGHDSIPYVMVDDIATLAWAANLGTIRIPRAALARGASPQASFEAGLHGVRPRPRPGDVDRRSAAGRRLCDHRSPRGRDGIGRASPRPAAPRVCSSMSPLAAGYRRGTICAPTLTTIAHPRRVRSSRARGVQHAQGARDRTGCSSTGARTTRPRRRWPCTRSTVWPNPPCRRRSPIPRCARAATHNDPTLLRFTTGDVVRRVQEHGDLFGPLAAR